MKNDILSSLLAKEKLRVVRASVTTASFNIKTRFLTLPAWKNISDELEMMLICHEVGHALYTTDDMTEQFCELLGVTTKTIKKNQFSYMNVVEDVRIEQLIKLKYPGVQKFFKGGYDEFVDVFGAFKNHKSLTLQDLLIDRLNVHTKLGYRHTVPFTDVEMEIVDRVIANESKYAVAVLAKEIYLYDKELLQNNPKPKPEPEEEQPKQKPESEEMEQEEVDVEQSDEGEEEGETPEEGDPQEVPDENADEETDETGSGKSGSNNDEEAGEPIPETAFEEHSPNIAIDTNFKSYFINKDDFIVPGKYFANRCAQGVRHVDASDGGVRYLREWRDLNSPSINYLVKEFQMRQAAATQKSISQHRTGLLNDRMLATYQINKDVFLTKEVVEEGQSHGVIVAIDYSGSMEGMVGAVLKQGLMVAEFCKKVQIPFSVFCFTTGANALAEKSNMPFVNLSAAGYGDYFTNSNAYGFEILSSNMSKQEYERAARLLQWRNCWESSHGKDCPVAFSKMSGTPTVNAMLSLYDQVGVMKRKNNVDKVGVFVLTDGESAIYSPCELHTIDGRTLDLNTNDSAAQLEQVYAAMKSRYSDSVHVCGIRMAFKNSSNMTRDFPKFIRDYDGASSSNSLADVEKIIKETRAAGHYICKKPRGADSWIFALIEKTTEMNVGDATKDAKNIAKAFTKEMNKGVIERNLLNFIVNAIK